MPDGIEFLFIGLVASPPIFNKGRHCRTAVNLKEFVEYAAAGIHNGIRHTFIRDGAQEVQIARILPTMNQPHIAVIGLGRERTGGCVWPLLCSEAKKPLWNSLTVFTSKPVLQSGYITSMHSYPAPRPRTAD